MPMTLRIALTHLKGHSMRILSILTALMILNGCMNAADRSAFSAALDQPMTDHAASLAGNDVALMRRTGVVVIATYDAMVGLK